MHAEGPEPGLRPCTRVLAGISLVAGYSRPVLVSAPARHLSRILVPILTPLTDKPGVFMRHARGSRSDLSSEYTLRASTPKASGLTWAGNWLALSGGMPGVTHSEGRKHDAAEERH